MLFIRKPLVEYHPLVQLVWLFIAIFSLGFVCTMLSFGIIYVFYDLDLFSNINPLYNYKNPKIADPMRIFQMFSTSIGLFILPSIWFLFVYNRERLGVLNSRSIRFSNVLLVLALMFVASPFVFWLYNFNQSLDLPAWMGKSEKEADEVTKLLLQMPNLGTFLFNLLVVAIMPAVGEELMFRGVLQRIFTQFSKNIHIAIWLTAILFSAMHMQFYGFLPRMALGVLFGYLYLWTGTIWIPIWGHFVNNAAALIFELLRSRKITDFKEEELGANNTALVLVSVFVSTFLLLMVFRQWKKSIPTTTLQTLGNQTTNT